MACLFIITVPPTLTVLFCIALEHFGGSLSAMLLALNLDGFLSFCHRYAPVPSIRATIAYATWVLFQAALYTTHPGRWTGQLTPAGYPLEYPTNGLLAWLLTTFLAAITTFSGRVDPATLGRPLGRIDRDSQCSWLCASCNRLLQGSLCAFACTRPQVQR